MPRFVNLFNQNMFRFVVDDKQKKQKPKPQVIHALGNIKYNIIVILGF